MVKALPANAGDLKRCKFNPWVRKILWRRAWQPTPIFLPGESHGQRSLVGYSPWGHRELDMTEATEHTHTNQREALGRHREKAAACEPRKGASAETNPAAISTPSRQDCEKVNFSCSSPCSVVLCHGSPTKLLCALRPFALGSCG